MKIRKKTQLINIINEIEDITTDPEVIKKIVRKSYKTSYAHTFDNLEDMGQFLQNHRLPKLK